MATKRQIEANRHNAKRSTGPKTAFGRLASARNARRHGLSMPMELDDELAGVVSRLGSALNVDIGFEGNNVIACEVAERHLDVRRVRQARCTAIQRIFGETKNFGMSNNLAGFDRYERSAAVKRRKSIANLLKG